MFSVLDNVKKYIPFIGTVWIKVMLSKLREALQTYIDFFFFFQWVIFACCTAGKLLMTSADSYIPDSTILYKCTTRS